MPTVSKLNLLPAEVRAWLDSRLVANAFGNYDDLTDQLNQKLAEHDLELRVSRSGLGVYGKTLKERIEKIRASTSAAKVLNETLDDDGDALGMANIALAQDLMFQLMNRVNLDDPDQKVDVDELSMLFRALGNISRASLPQKKWAKSVREELERKTSQAAAEIQSEAGLTDEQAAIIRAKILGIKIDG